MAFLLLFTKALAMDHEPEDDHVYNFPDDGIVYDDLHSRLLGVSEASQTTAGVSEASQKTTGSDPSTNCLTGQVFEQMALKTADSLDKLVQDLNRDHVRDLPFIGEDLFEYEQAVAIARDMLRINAKMAADEVCVFCTEVEKFVGQLLAKVDSVIDNIFNEEIIKEAKQITFEIGVGFENLCSKQQGEASEAAPPKLGHGRHSGRNSCPVWLPQAQSQRSPGSLGYVCTNAGKICSYPDYNMTFKCDKHDMVWKQIPGSGCPLYTGCGQFCDADQAGMKCTYPQGTHGNYPQNTMICMNGRWEPSYPCWA